MSDLAEDVSFADLPRSGGRRQRGSQGQGGGTVRVEGRFEVEPGFPLPALDQPHAHAFAAAARDQAGGRPVYALVCDPLLAPRRSLMSQLPTMGRLPLAVPLAYETVFWPPDNARRGVLILTKPEGDRVQANPQASFAPFDEDALIRKVVQPLMPALIELGARGISHRAIRADNLFFRDGARNECMLGECVSAPAALDQPSVYEPIESALALPAGRGLGSTSDDLYAFGVTLAILLRGGNPVADMTDEQIVHAKLNRGTYATLIGKQRLPLAITEALRGLLCDEPIERWGLNDLEMWANGRHLSPKQPMALTRASRPFEFNEKDYWNCRSLSAAFGYHWDEACRTLAGEELITWVHRSVGDEKRAERLALLMRGSQGGTSSEPRSDRQLARVLMALDARAPLRFRQLSARIDSLGDVLAVHYADQSIRQIFAETIGNRLVNFWFEAQPGMRPEYAVLKKGYEQLGFFLMRQRIGYGLERCLYEENEFWPCLSPLLSDAYVTRIEELLPALERLTANGLPEREPVDRHVAAFAVARMRGTPERILTALGRDDDEVVRRLGVVYLLAEVQRLVGPARLPGLAAWLGQSMAPVIESYNSREIRQTLALELQAAVDGGDLYHLALAMDDGKLRQDDERGFAAAQAEYTAIGRELAWIEQGGLTRPQFVFAKSQQIAAVAAGCLASITLLVMTMFYFG
ncbi:hypothetical protein SAMN06265365_12189 [Tistlia consotensis]|uniref:Protein kinase domain-containing protein n=1 Tax=Tistlia consotensis USBA 355 TaxID=560819 RepID=A0A1Y6CKA0_9PROT|nr:hypothetical protein [Tistlia consotensis]SMF60294.1 hypothetical protein SAMN05428998_12334 [Tistlia consotensis USBA 355]SNR93594.1 hypothetical protein SAMN06265365_12189 [Tistlia consotensis]